MDYTTALLGRSRSYLYVDGPYQQISIVDEIKNLKLSNVSLLHLRTAVNFTHHALPLFVEKKYVRRISTALSREKIARYGL